mgnify:CR=1 FL=1
MFHRFEKAIQKDGPPGLCPVGRCHLQVFVLPPTGGPFGPHANHSRLTPSVSRRNASFRRKPWRRARRTLTMSIIEISALRIRAIIMFISIRQQTPHGVWWLLAGLVSIGVSQTQPRHRTLRAATAIPVAMAALSFYGVVSVFSHESFALVAWAVAMLAALAISHAARVGSKVRWLAAEQRLLVPGSWVPLMLMLGLFIIKFGANVPLATHPDMSIDGLFAGSVSFAYGAFSGIFLARGLAMWRAALQAEPSGMAY